ncbi:MAG: ABC transporter permease, partial [Solirubrobacteraceae bacterium]
LAGRTSADVFTNALSMAILIATGLAIGFSFQTNVLHVLAGLVLALTFGYAFSWVFAYLGLLVKTPEAANSVGFIAVFPLTFISSAFVPGQTLPAPLRQFADVNPFTIVVNELRWLWTGQPSPDHVWQAFAWVVFILVLFSPLAVQRYRRAAGR